MYSLEEKVMAEGVLAHTTFYFIAVSLIGYQATKLTVLRLLKQE